jgi:hypothetical protein
MTPIGLGFRALRGGAVAVGVAVDGGEPHVVLSTFLATAAEGDRLALEPYHVAAADMAQGAPRADIAAAVAEGRKRQELLAAIGLRDIVRRLNDAGATPVVAALLVNRAGWMTDLLAYSLASPDHPPVAEGLAVREALRLALRGHPLDVAEMDEKSLPELASHALDRGSAALDARLKVLGAAVGPPWRKEQKLACLAAWLAIATKAK